MDIIKTMQEYSDLISGVGVSEEKIQNAETSLQLQFSDEYRKYLTVFGIAAVNGHEFTGICESQRVNVTNVTFTERNRMPTARAEWYVVEQANIDGIVIWQSSTGEVYQTIPNGLPIKLCNSLSEYLDL